MPFYGVLFTKEVEWIVEAESYEEAQSAAEKVSDYEMFWPEMTTEVYDLNNKPKQIDAKVIDGKFCDK